MRCTALKVIEAGVVLLEYHARRLAPEKGAAWERFRGFARRAAPGFYLLLDDGDELRVQARGPSALFDGMPARFAPSPIAGAAGPIAKPVPPGPYKAVRAPGTATLLLSADGAEILESCSAAAVGWDGGRFALVPADRPRVESTAEAAIAATLPHTRAPIGVGGDMPLALVNAIKGPCRLDCPGRRTFPPEALQELDRALLATARRP